MQSRHDSTMARRTGGLRRSWAQGEVNVWITGGAVGMTLLMVALLLFVVMVNGLGYFWPSNMALVTLSGEKRLLGEITAREPGGEGQPDNLQIKVGNRDLYGQDFRWVKGSDIASIDYLFDAVRVERQEFGNFHGFLYGINAEGLGLPTRETPWLHFLDALAAVRDRAAEIEPARGALGVKNLRIEALRLRIQKLRFSGDAGDRNRIARLEEEMEALVKEYEAENQKISERIATLRKFTATFRDAEGKTKDIVLMDIVRVARPNDMSVLAKVGFYAAKVWELLSDEPRESNTEGGLFPAIFGTVMMVMLMSLFSLPLGVIAAIYLREYAREGLLVRLVRIAVYNLAGVPSIVFGVFGLGFFVYGVGGTIDQVFFPERLPTPTFGTGGILWASLTLSLLTVPVVIVATEEGLSIIPRGIREASLALGATRFQTLVRVVFPMAVPGIITGFILAMARAAGEVAPLMITGVVKLAPALPVDGVFPYLHLDRKFMHLGFHIYDVGFQSPNVEAAKPMVYITTLLLILIVLALSLTAIVLRNFMRKRFQSSTF